MKRLFLVFALWMLAVSLVEARRAAPPPIALRIAAADAAVVGEVTAFGDKLIPADLFKGDTSQLQVATVKVEEALLGGIKAKEIRVGFPAGGRGRGAPVPPVELNQSGAFLLTRHPTQANLFVVRNWYDVVSKKDNSEFPKELAAAKHAVKLLANPNAGLSSLLADERYLTAAMLLTKYRTERTGSEKLEPIPAEESKKILSALAEADWSGRNARLGFGMAPLSLFARLQLTDKDGWKPPMEFARFPEEAKKWLRDNAGTYRIKRYVHAVQPDPEPSR